MVGSGEAWAVDALGTTHSGLCAEDAVSVSSGVLLGSGTSNSCVCVAVAKLTATFA